MGEAGNRGRHGGPRGERFAATGQWSFIRAGLICKSPAHPSATPGRPLRPPVHPLRTCCRHRYARGQTPWHHWLSSRLMDKRRPPRPKQSPPGPPRGGADPRRVCVHPLAFLGQNSHPHPTPPPAHPHPQLTPIPLSPPTTHTWLIEVPKGCAKVSIGCLAVGF